LLEPAVIGVDVLDVVTVQITMAARPAHPQPAGRCLRVNVSAAPYCTACRSARWPHALTSRRDYISPGLTPRAALFIQRD
jgi:hypothetical protein